jgi:hypothetical protein
MQPSCALTSIVKDINANNSPSVFGLFIAWRLRHQSKGEWLSANRTQKGKVQRHATTLDIIFTQPVREWKLTHNQVSRSP